MAVSRDDPFSVDNRTPHRWGTNATPTANSFQSMIHAYIGQLVEDGRSPNTIRTRTHFLTRYANDNTLETATPASIREWLQSHDWSDGTRYTALVSIRAWYTWAAAAGLVDTNPAKRIPLNEPANVNRPVCDDLSIRRALNNATREERIAIRLAAECGLRVHELIKVHTRDINGDVVTVVGKGLRVRRVIASPELLNDLPDDGYLLPGKSNGHRSIVWAYEHIRALTGYPPHALRRRAAATVYRQSGHDVRLTQKFLGHANMQTTMYYLGVELEDLARAGGMTRLAA